jgi:hypothetical protein
MRQSRGNVVPLSLLLFMAAQSPFPHSPFAGAAPYAASLRQQAPSGGRLSRIGYVAAWALLGVASVAGLFLSLYRNDVLLAAARRGGWEPRYLALEARMLGTPGWGTPRSLSTQVDAATPESAISAAPAVAVVTPARAVPVAAAARPIAAPVAASASPARATSDGVAIVSLDALATLPVQAAARAPAPARRIAEETAPARAVPARAAPVAPPPKAPAAKAPVAKAPAPAAPARAAAAAPPVNENPLKAAIRTAIVKESQAK